MSLLITELVDKVEYVTEATSDGKKALYIEGTFMQYDTPNRNGRRYPRHVMEQEVNRYIKEAVEQNRAYGELNHPQGPTINLDKVCHLITKLEIQPKGLVYAKAKVVGTPAGKIVEGLIEAGANLGVSSRGLGTLKEGRDGIMEVQNDFRLVTAGDVVADPSAPAAFVKGILENVEWVFNENTLEWVATTRKQLHQMNKRELEESALKYFQAYLQQL